ncbi:hypothetical protein K2173_009203 [Erythroxylum novogranatense]|uniref:Polygalacturonase n=1 Tax=Erythroxylum novogranatense TaxID=1862640 RepID=A0AAV8TJ44_9ROSI|nr:hypothetical protein K2173_009203 [Erythroxylum novogranatense]
MLQFSLSTILAIYSAFSRTSYLAAVPVSSLIGGSPCQETMISAEAPDDSPCAFVPAPSPECSEGFFDVTEFGAIGDAVTDNSMVFIETWDAACSYEGDSIFYVPEGTFLVGSITLSGPCYNNQSPEVNIKGQLVAPTSLDAFPDSNWIQFKHLRGIVIYGEAGLTELDARGGVEAWKDPSCHKSATCEKMVTSLKLDNVSYGIISNVTLLNGKGFHVGIHESENINIQNITVTAPWNSPNTDGIHITLSTNVSITSSTIGVGDDCVSMGPGSVNISIFDIKCGPGHGISVGSLGKSENEESVVGVNVSNCTINGTTNGVRVKTWPGSPVGSASNITFQNIVMTNVSNPIIIDQKYCPSNSCDISKPSLVKLSNIVMQNISGTYNNDFAVTLLCSSKAPCENIWLLDVKLNYTKTSAPRQGPFIVEGVIDGLEIIGSTF